MNWKDVLKPRIIIILLTILITLLLTIIPFNVKGEYDVVMHNGLPIPFIVGFITYPDNPHIHSFYNFPELRIHYLLIDLLFWYTLICILRQEILINRKKK